MTESEKWIIPEIALTVDIVVLTVREEALQILLVERKEEPFRGMLALPGGFLHDDREAIDAAALRELTEETGLVAQHSHLEQLKTYGAPDRDPRRRVVTVCYLALLPDLPVPVAGGDAAKAAWMPVAKALRKRTPLAFDHREIITEAVERARNKLEYSTLAAAFCAPEFTMSDLRRIYEIVWGEELDPRNFHRKILGSTGFLVPTGDYRATGQGRPAALYRRGAAAVLHPALLRSR